MAGGQRGQSWLGENNIWIAGLVFGLCVAVGVVGCDDILPSADPTPVEDHQTDCQQAWADDQSGEADDTDKKLLATKFCDKAVAAEIARVEANQQQELQETRADAAQAPPTEDGGQTPVSEPKVLAVVGEDGTVHPVQEAP